MSGNKEALDHLEIELRTAERDLAHLEAARLREQLAIVEDVLLDGKFTAEEKVECLIHRLGFRAAR